MLAAGFDLLYRRAWVYRLTEAKKCHTIILAIVLSITICGLIMVFFSMDVADPRIACRHLTSAKNMFSSPATIISRYCSTTIIGGYIIYSVNRRQRFNFLSELPMLRLPANSTAGRVKDISASTRDYKTHPAPRRLAVVHRAGKKLFQLIQQWRSGRQHWPVAKPAYKNHLSNPAESD